MSTTKVKVASLVEDFDLYPRVDVDSHHINEIAHAYTAGIKLPPPIVESKTLRIIDGFHRSRAWRKTFGEESDIIVETRSFKDDSDIFAEAMRLNSCHGRNMTTYDKTHAITRGLRMKIEPDVIAECLNISIERVTELTTERVTRIQNSRGKAILKMPIRHMAGKELTQEQADAIPKLGGNHQLFYVNQLITLIETEMLDVTNERLMDGIATLAKLIKAVLK